MKKYRVAIDIGGTFTDFVVADDTKNDVHVGKVPTTPQNYALSILEGLKDLVPDPREIYFIVHGTTIGINTFLERKGSRVLLITTEGFRDSYIIARGDRKELYAAQYHKPKRLVPRRDIHEVRERIIRDGSILEDLHPEDFDPIIAKIKKENIISVAICFLHSYINPIHELAAKKILLDAVPNLSVTLSHQIAREWREYERASTAVMNAYISQSVETYLANLDKDLKSLGIPSVMHVMQSNGGMITASSAAKFPIKTLLSGPVGGTSGGKALSKVLGRPNLICIDMGGTSFDVSLIVNGEARVSSETDLQGIPLLIPIVDINTIGAGGGSIGWLEAESLRVGPQSAGADPGPACYRRGGSAPTITDANLALKRINPNKFLGGHMVLDEGCAVSALGTISHKLGIDPTQLAEGMIEIVNSKMADAIRTITIQHGIDPRSFSLVAYGGAGPMHAVWLARALEIPEVIVPWYPGTFSAWGMLQTDIRQDFVTNYYKGLGQTDLDSLRAQYYELEKEGEVALLDEGILLSDISFLWSADMRYVGQEHSVLVPINRSDNLSEINESFHRTHHEMFGHSSPKDPIEFVNLRIAVYGAMNRESTTKPTILPRGGINPIIGYRDVVFDGTSVKTKIIDRDLLTTNSMFQGPLVMEEATATTVVPNGYELTIDKFGNAIITKE